MHRGGGAVDDRNAKLGHPLDELGNPEAGEPRSLTQRQAALAIQRYREGEPDARLREQRVIIEMHQQRLRLMSVEYHNRVFTRLAKCR